MNSTIELRSLIALDTLSKVVVGERPQLKTSCGGAVEELDTAENI